MRINLYGVPSCGKSTLSSYIYRELKKCGKVVEEVKEYVKPWAYKKEPIEGYMNLKAIVSHLDQEYDLLEKCGVKAIVTDSPVLLGYYYSKTYEKFGTKGLEYILAEHETRYPAYHVLIKYNPDFPYDTHGRYQSQKESQNMQHKIFAEVTNFLNTYMKGKYNLKSIDAGNETHERDLVKLLKEKL